MSKVVTLRPKQDFEKAVEFHMSALTVALAGQPDDVANPCYLVILVAKEILLKAAKGEPEN